MLPEDFQAAQDRSMTQGFDHGHSSNVVPLWPNGHPLQGVATAGYQPDFVLVGDEGNSQYDRWSAQNLGRELMTASQDCVEVIDDLGHMRVRNPMARQMFGAGVLSGLDYGSWTMSWPVAAQATVSDAQATATAVGTARFGGWRPTARGEPLYWDVVLSRIVDVEGMIVGMLSVSRDMTQLRRIEDGHDLRGRELSHRLKNIFALVTGIVTLSARNIPAVQPYAQTLRERFTAMSRALDYLHVLPPDERAASPRQTLQGLLGALLGPYDDAADIERRFRFGAVDDVPVGDGAVTGLALVIHELATNAIKHGALSEEGGSGTVTIDCRRDGDGMCLTWTERGGPRIANPPRREGFGSKLTERTVCGQLGGMISHFWDPEGLRVLIVLPRASLAS